MEGLCSATNKKLPSPDNQDPPFVKEEAIQLLGLLKIFSLFWEKESMNTGENLETRTGLKEKKTNKEVQVFYLQRLWELVRLKIKWTEGSNQKVNEYTNKVPRIRGVIIYKHIPLI